MPLRKDEIHPLAKELAINENIVEMLKSFSELQSIDFSTLPNIGKLLLGENPANTEVGEPHENLFTTANLYEGGVTRITSVYYQRIDEQGQIAEHDHSATNEHEILIFSNQPGYANIPSSNNLRKVGSGLQVVFIPVGTRHGSDDESSHGDWVSIKVKAD